MSCEWMNRISVIIKEEEKLREGGEWVDLNNPKENYRSRRFKVMQTSG